MDFPFVKSLPHPSSFKNDASCLLVKKTSLISNLLFFWLKLILLLNTTLKRFMLRIRYACSNCSRCYYRYVKFELDILKYIFKKKSFHGQGICVLSKNFTFVIQCALISGYVYTKKPQLWILLILC